MKTIVLKLGGEIVHSPELDVVACDLRALVDGWNRVAIVHGGGAQATALQKTLGLETRMVAGRRYTDEKTLEVMKYVVAGQLNGQINCRERLEILPTGRVSGQIDAGRFIVHEGAYLGGQVRMTGATNADDGARPMLQRVR